MCLKSDIIYRRILEVTVKAVEKKNLYKKVEIVIFFSLEYIELTTCR
jgi:hypothetical protein